MRVMCASVKQFCAGLKMTFRLQPRQTASAIVIVATPPDGDCRIARSQQGIAETSLYFFATLHAFKHF
jgi:hypothetical protein